MCYSLRVEEVSFGYKQSQPLGCDVNFACKKGDILAVLGANGRGKTTLLNTLLGIQAPLSGKITRNGLIGFVPQSFHCPFAYQVFDLVLMGRSVHIGLFNHPSKQDKYIAQHALDQLGIAHLAQQEYNELSGGQKQLVLIARALAMQCETLILDEPVAALDLSNQQIVLNLIHQLANDNISLIFTTHDPSHALKISDNTLILKENTHQYGLSETILTEQNLRQTYHVDIKRLQLEHNGRYHEIVTPLFCVPE